MEPQVVIVDYGVGNVGSIVNMLRRVGANAVLGSDPDSILRAPKLILPGVGAFDAGIQTLQGRGLVPALNEAVLTRKTPTLGLCLGMQLMGEGSEEGSLPGLGWIPFRCARFQSSESGQPLRVPHMGWASITPRRPHALTAGLPPDHRFYFVHSYHAVCEDDSNVLAVARYGIEFPCAVGRDNILGVQFHPEKSHRFGMALLASFVQLP